MSEERVGPGRWWYWLAAAVLVSGLILAVLLGYRGVRAMLSLGDAVARVVVPGNAELTLAEAGEYSIWHEYRSVVDGTGFVNEPDLPGLRCALRAPDTGDAVALAPSSASASYSIGSRAGVLVWRFRAERPGTYALSCRYAAGQAGPNAVLAVSEADDVFTGIFTIVGAVGLFFVSAGIAATIFVVTLIRRQRASRPQPAAAPVTAAASSRTDDVRTSATPRYCQNCGAPVGVGGRFCAACGAPLAGGNPP
jgi:hypothetical protein